MNAGLVVLIIVIVLDVAGLSLDGALYLTHGYEGTVTCYVRTGGQDGAWLGLGIVMLQGMAALGAAWHFWGA